MGPVACQESNGIAAKIVDINHEVAATEVERAQSRAVFIEILCVTATIIGALAIALGIVTRDYRRSIAYCRSDGRCPAGCIGLGRVVGLTVAGRGD